MSVIEGRKFGSTTDQRNGKFLNDQLCAAVDLEALASKSAWLQYYHVMLVVAHVLLLQNRYRSAPTIRINAAMYQIMGGLADNPYAHVVPCTIKIDGQPMPKLYSSPKAIAEMERIFGLGVMGATGSSCPLGGLTLPWIDPRKPLLLNQADSAAEHHHQLDGLCEALRRTLEVATQRVEWTGAGGNRASDDMLVSTLRYVDALIWRPNMKFAYESAISRVGTSIAAATTADKRAQRQGRQDVLRIKLRTHEDSFAKMDHWQILGQAVSKVSDETGGRGVGG
ncbi:hypothetical protein SAMN05216359_105218 [Roseateles sp. YR242]|uniref:hypothetical protein n=1 Tax=Roseateles sp. YR242 TaxID=1855305 RepID=UPI0008CC218B|nr:hypothetical protein [Roseateles sp. YR242]SEL10932.1 hypothetical protein SAMN05216359_105218 [Roseateles sp. YR242]